MAIKSMNELDTLEKRHNFFTFALNKMEPANHVSYYCIQQYKAAPSKRKAIFIYEHFIQGYNVGVSHFDETAMQDTYKLLRPVNLYDTGTYQGQVTAVETAVGNIKKVKTWFGKLRSKTALVNQYKRPDAQLFDQIESQVVGVMLYDWFPSFDPRHTYDYDGGYSKQIQLARVALQKATFDPDDMAVYG